MSLKQLAKRGLDLLHRAGARAGLLILPNHYYSPFADRRELRRNRAHWARRAPLHGIQVDAQRQLAALAATVARFEPEYRGNRRYLEGVAGGYGPGYGYVEAQCLHGVVRALKPRRIVEVGSGVSTHVMLGALEANAAEGSPRRDHLHRAVPARIPEGERGDHLGPQPRAAARSGAVRRTGGGRPAVHRFDACGEAGGRTSNISICR
ncbi:MAG: hypothetical protein WDN24_13105 [Sphingomonas sp.]